MKTNDVLSLLSATEGVVYTLILMNDNAHVVDNADKIRRSRREREGKTGE